MVRHDLDKIRSDNPLPGIVGTNVALKRAGNEMVGCCPFHADKSPSFTIFDGGQRFYCFGCAAGGDVLDYVQRLHAVTLREAVDLLEGGNLPVVSVRAPEAAPDRDTVEEARKVWRSSGPIAGTPAEAYLRSRGILISLPDSLRFARLPFGRGRMHPAMVAIVAGPDDRLWGVQRTFLTEDGRKANLPGGKVKYSLGKVKGGAVRLAPGGAKNLIVCEGIEDGLSLLQLEGRAVWAAAGAGMLAGMRLPSAVSSVIIAADADPAGREAARRAADAFAAEGRAVRIIYPLAPAKDFNDELQGACA